MSAIALAASVVVGISLVVAGATKLAARDSWPSQASGLGAPSWVIPIVPWFELILGALLVTQVARPVMAMIAIVLFVVFTALIAVKLRQGQHPPCACFGAWSAKPIGGGHVARNLALIALAVLAVF